MSYFVGLVARNPSQYADDFNRMVEVMRKTPPGVAGRHDVVATFNDEPNGVRFASIRSIINAESQPGNNDPYSVCAINEPKLAIVLEGYLQGDCATAATDDLARRNVPFRSQTDAELLLLMYREYGVEFLKKLDGAFAFAIWDARDNRLLLARDHLGQRPLLYYADRDRLLFGSALRAIRSVRGVPNTLNLVAMRQYLFYQNVPEPLSILESVTKLQQGHYAIYQNGELTVKPWWDYDFNSESSDVSPEVWRERIAATLPKPIAEIYSGGALTPSGRLGVNSQVGTFLSGGIDSSIMTGLASEYANASNGPTIKSFSIGFRHDEYNEASVAKTTAERLETVHEERIIETGVIDILPQLAWYYDEPFADSSMIPVWFVAQLAAGKTDVIFCGDGGDELFSGYLRHQAISLASKLDVLPKPLRQLLGGPIRRMIPAPVGQKSKRRRFKRFLEAVGYDTLERYSQWVTLFNKERLAELLSPDITAKLTGENPLLGYEKIFASCPNRDLVTAVSLIDLRAGISCNAMVKVGTAAAAFGLECRYPFLAREMVELAFQIPSCFKRQGEKGKLILRDVYRRFLPPDIDSRPKMGFGAPLDHWLRRGPLADHAREMLTDPQAIARGLFQQKYVERLLDEHQNAVFDHAYRIWALLMLEHWHVNSQ